MTTRGNLIKIIRMISNTSNESLAYMLRKNKKDVMLYQEGKLSVGSKFICEFCALLGISEKLFYEMETYATQNQYSYSETIRLVLKNFEDLEISLATNNITAKCLKAARIVSGCEIYKFTRIYDITSDTVKKVEKGKTNPSSKTIQIYAYSAGLNARDFFEFIIAKETEKLSDKEIIAVITEMSINAQK